MQVLSEATARRRAVLSFILCCMISLRLVGLHQAFKAALAVLPIGYLATSRFATSNYRINNQHVLFKRRSLFAVFKKLTIKATLKLPDH